MNLLDGKNALVFGVANDHSIAWGIAQAMHEHGAQLAFSYASDPLERRVRPLAESVDSDFVELCDVTDDHQIEAVFAKASEKLGSIDILVHAVAYADREDLKGDFHMTSRSGFHLAMDVSVYSFIALARAALPLMKPGGSMLTLSYYGGQKVVPNYNVMGVAKAALEASTRYLAADLGRKNIRVNAISAGPMRTLAGSAIGSARKIFKYSELTSPLHRSVELKEIGGTGVYLLSELSGAVTGEVHYVDCGFNAVGMCPTEYWEELN